MLNTGDIAVNKTSKNPCSHGAYLIVENIGNKISIRLVRWFTYNANNFKQGYIVWPL